jgi:hypothetical protein
MPPRAPWTGHGKLSEVSCPVRLYLAGSSSDRVSVLGLRTASRNRIRMRPGAPVSTPLRWSEIAEIDDPADLNYSTVPVRLTEVDDPWAELAGSARSLTRDMERKLQPAR